MTIKKILTADVMKSLASNDADHARMRRCINHAFSDQALRSQEPIIGSYITLLISKLQSREQDGVPVDIMRYVNYATFDILGDLCFGESFNALESEEYSEWMTNLFKSVKLVPFVRLFKQYPIIGLPFWILTKIFPQILAARTKHDNYTVEKTAKRMEKDTERKDFMR
jgi:cytochrome P450